VLGWSQLFEEMYCQRQDISEFCGQVYCLPFSPRDDVVPAVFAYFLLLEAKSRSKAARSDASETALIDLFDIISAYH